MQGLNGNGQWQDLDSVETVPALRQYIPQTQIRIVAKSSENIGDGEAAKLLDGRLDTMWHSKWEGGAAAVPHWVVLDLGEVREGLASLNYLARTGSVNGVAKDYKVWISDSADSFTGEPISGILQNVPSTQRIDLHGASGRYLKFQIDTDYSGAAKIAKTGAGIAEFALLAVLHLCRRLFLTYAYTRKAGN